MKMLTKSDLEYISLDPSAIAMVPESVARDSCVLPGRWDGTRLYLVLRCNAGIGGDPTMERLNQILNCDYFYDFAAPDDLAPIVNLFYTAIYAEIENCPEFRYRCPKGFSKLAATKHPLVRYCAECNQNVHYCRVESELTRHAERGECVAYSLKDEPQGSMGLPM